MSNLTTTTREAFEKSLISQVFQKQVILAIMTEHDRIKVSGTGLKMISQKSTGESLAQDYSGNDPMTSGSIDRFDNPTFGWKKWQLPVEYNSDDDLENEGTEAQVSPVNLVETLVKCAQDDAKRHVAKLMYTDNTTTSDSGKKCQSLIDALSMSTLTYGAIVRSTTANTHWNGASLAGTWADQATAITPSISNLRSMLYKVKANAENDSDKLYVVCGTSIFSQLRTQLEVKLAYTTEGSALRRAKYGLDTMMFDGAEIVRDSYLDVMTPGTTDKYLFILNPSTWRYAMHPKRAMKFTGFTWQGDQANGLDKYMGRILWKGNLMCANPNQNMFRSNVA